MSSTLDSKEDAEAIVSKTKVFQSVEEVHEHFLKTNDKIIIFEGSVYDSSGYVEMHPGGS